MKNLTVSIIFLINALNGFSQDCGIFQFSNFKDTIVTDWIWDEPRKGFYFDMNYDTLTAPNTGYISFYLVDVSGDTITNKEYYASSYFFPFLPNNTRRYTMVLDSSLNALPLSFSGYLITENPSCQIPVSYTLTGAEDILLREETKVYPNPTNGLLFLDQYYKEISVFNADGKLLKNKIHGNSMDVSMLDAGIYILKVLSDKNEWITRKIIKY